MKAKKLRRKIRKGLARLAKEAALITCSSGNAELVHTFRIAYKKARALVRLSHTKRSGSKVEIPGIFKKAYHQTGKVRELQLYCAAMQPSLNKGSWYLFKIHRNIRVLELQLSKLVSTVKVGNESKSAIWNAPKRIQAGMLRKFLRAKAKSARAFLAPNAAADKTLHSCRKELKDILYCSGFFAFPLPGSLASTGVADEKGLRELIDLLNKHQDYADNLKIMRTAAYPIFSFQERAILKKMERQWEYQKRLLARRIMNRRWRFSGVFAS